MVAVDGHLLGVIVMADEVRPDVASIVERLRVEGIRHGAMLAGVGRELGIHRVYAEQPPEGKLEVVPTVGRDRQMRS